MTPAVLTRLKHRIRDTSRADRRDPAMNPVDGGFTLIEVLVSFVLFSVVAGAAVTGMVNAIGASHTSQQRVDAASMAQKYAVVTGDMSSLRAGAQTPFTDSVKNEQFTVRRTITFLGSATACAPGASFTLNVEVFQKQKLATDAGTKSLARTDAVIACA